MPYNQTDCCSCFAYLKYRALDVSKKCAALRFDKQPKHCPFFKTQEQLDKEQAAAITRLNYLGRFDLIERYYPDDDRA